MLYVYVVVNIMVEKYNIILYLSLSKVIFLYKFFFYFLSLRCGFFEGYVLR